MDYVRRDDCRSCGKPISQVLDLGSMPLANSFVSVEKLEAPEYKFPLSLAFCPHCYLAQVPDVVDPELLFRDYAYTTGSSPALVRHFENLAGVLHRFTVDSQDTVVEIGGNDGTLLSFLKPFCKVINVDPALNLADLNSGVTYIPAFFNHLSAQDIIREYGRAKVIVATNSFAHSDLIKDMAKGVSVLLRDDGVFVFEVHWVKNLLEDNCWDQIYHEHLCFYSLHALKNLLEPLDFHIFDVKIIPVHGQSLRVFASKQTEMVWPSVEMVLKAEREAGLTGISTFLSFGQKVTHNKDRLRTGLTNLRKRGARIAGYGAPAKGNVLLNYCKIHPHLVQYVTDTSKLKQGLYTPGVHIPVRSPDVLVTDRPDYLLLLAWNYKDSILEKEQKLRDYGVKFIIPVPEISIV